MSGRQLRLEKPTPAQIQWLKHWNHRHHKKTEFDRSRKRENVFVRVASGFMME